MKKHFFMSSRLAAVYRGFNVLTPQTRWSSYFMRTSPAQTHFQRCPFSANTRPEKSWTPPDRSATPYYVESFRFQPGFTEREFEILKVLSKTVFWSQFSGLTAANKNNALLILWNPNNCETWKNLNDAQPNFLQESVLRNSPSFFLDPCCWTNLGIPKRNIRISWGNPQEYQAIEHTPDGSWNYFRG